LLSVFVLIVVGYCFDIGIRRTLHHHHHHHVLHNESDGVITPTGGSFVGEVNSAENPEMFSIQS
jgi:hypothetical protein